MSLIQLNEKAVVDSFRQDLSSITFLAGCDTGKLDGQLDALTDANKKRYEKREAAKAIWELFFKQSVKAIATNTRGLDELCRYFAKFAKYENMLVALDENYRDHVIHTIWVMLLGCYLRKLSTPFNDVRLDRSMIDLSEGRATEAIEHMRERLKTREHPLWCLIALTHDLGYPIQKSKAANDTISDMIHDFGFLRQTPLDYNFMVVHQPAMQQLLDIMTAVVIWLPKGYRIGHKAGSRLDMAKSFEHLDHGIMSAYLLLMHLDYFCDLWNFLIVEGTCIKDPEDAAERIVASELLYAISSHTNKNVYSGELCGMSDLLFLADELEEFSRFSIVKDQWQNVKCRTEFEFKQDSLSLKYVFEDDYVGDLGDLLPEEGHQDQKTLPTSSSRNTGHLTGL